MFSNHLQNLSEIEKSLSELLMT